MSKLVVAEGIVEQSSNEELAWGISTTNWASSPTSPSAEAIDETLGTDVTSTVFPTNSPSVAGDVITLSLLKDLVKGHTYRIEVKFTVSSNIFECYFRVECPI